MSAIISMPLSGEAPSQDNPTVTKFNDLFLAVEDLLRRIADTDDLVIRRKRAKLREELIALQGEMPNIKSFLPQPPAAMVETGDGAWGEPALAALTGVALALTVFKRH
jgi:hypothetical protein